MKQKELQATSIIESDSFTRSFFPRLPEMIRSDVRRKIEIRKKRANPTRDNLQRTAREAVNFGLKMASFIENKYPFVDYRKGAKPHKLTHEILMRDEYIKKLAEKQANQCIDLMAGIEPEQFTDYLSALFYVYQRSADALKGLFILPPSVDLRMKDRELLELRLETAILKLQSEEWIEKRLLNLRAQYIEYTQIALQKVGKEKHQAPYVSRLSFANWKRKQREGLQFIDSTVVMNNDTGDYYDLAEVVKRTTANPENRRIEMMVRSRGFEELADELGYTALFITWTLPSKYHRISAKWNGASVKDGHNVLMDKWAVARAMIAKLGIDYFGFRVAEPHKDSTSHGHYFLFCSHKDKTKLINILRDCAITEDKNELGDNTSKRFDVKEADPSKGGATAYIAKYVSKNINGKHMPENEAEENAYRVRAWASTHSIRQFQQFGGEPVTLWRHLRKSTPIETLAIDEKLEEVRQAADTSKWSLFCKLAKDANIEYQEKKNKYNETVKKPIGFSWLDKIVITAKEQYSLVRKKDLKRTQKARSALPWSTENNCNQPLKKEVSSLESALITATGWSLDGVQCLIAPLMRGAKVQIDRYTGFQLRNGRLITI